MIDGADQSNPLGPVAQMREHIRQLEDAIIAQNEVIATLELSGRDARQARAIRAQLWVSQEFDRAELERMIGENDPQTDQPKA